jgi:hypothetical protein
MSYFVALDSDLAIRAISWGHNPVFTTKYGDLAIPFEQNYGNS